MEVKGRHRAGPFLLPSREWWGGGAEAADGCTKWIFLVCNEAVSSASLWVEEWRGVPGMAEDKWQKREEAAKSGMQMLEAGWGGGGGGSSKHADDKCGTETLVNA